MLFNKTTSMIWLSKIYQLLERQRECVEKIKIKNKKYFKK